MLIALAAAAPAVAAAGPAATLKAQVRYLHAGRYASFYALMSPRFRASCPFATFERTAPTQRRNLAGATLQVVRTHVKGNAATIDYRFVRNGQQLSITGDKYVRVKGKWLDELDKYTSC
jgi:hypothetical protein